MNISNRLKGFYKYRNLFQELVIKDIKLKYRRSFLGYLWSVLNPLLTMLVMWAVFVHMFRFEIENYPTYLIIGQTIFAFMTEATTNAIFSITSNASLIKKVYVPKYIFTMSKVTSSLVNLLFSLVAMILVFVINGIQFHLKMIFIPFIILEVYIFSMGLGLLLAQAAVFFRDIQYIYSVLTTAWMYLTPIFYPVDSLSQGMQKLITTINPMYSYIAQFRMLVLENQMPSFDMIMDGCLIAVVILGIGLYSFFKTQDKFILYI